MTKRKKMSNRMKAILAILVALAMVLSFVSSLVLGVRKSASQLISEGERSFAEADYDRAISLYNKALEQNPSMSNAYNKLGMAYRMKYRETKEAKLRAKEIESFRKALSLNSRNVDALVNLGMTLFDINRKTEAARYLKRALEVYPEHPDKAQIEELIRKAESP